MKTNMAFSCPFNPIICNILLIKANIHNNTHFSEENNLYLKDIPHLKCNFSDDLQDNADVKKSLDRGKKDVFP